MLTLNRDRWLRTSEGKSENDQGLQAVQYFTLEIPPGYRQLPSGQEIIDSRKSSYKNAHFGHQIIVSCKVFFYCRSMYTRFVVVFILLLFYMINQLAGRDRHLFEHFEEKKSQFVYLQKCPK